MPAGGVLDVPQQRCGSPGAPFSARRSGARRSRVAAKSFSHEQPRELACVAHRARTLARPDVEIHAAAGRLGGGDVIEDGALPEPHRRAHGARAPEHRRISEERVEADERAHRRSEDHRVVAVRARAEQSIDPRLERVDEKLEIRLAFATAESAIGKRTVLREPLLARVMHADDDDLEASGGQALERRFEIPGACECRRRIRQILAVLHVDDRVSAMPGRPVRRGQIDVDIVAIAPLRRPDVFEGSFHRRTLHHEGHGGHGARVLALQG